MLSGINKFACSYLLKYFKPYQDHLPVSQVIFLPSSTSSFVSSSAKSVSIVLYNSSGLQFTRNECNINTTLVRKLTVSNLQMPLSLSVPVLVKLEYVKRLTDTAVLSADFHSTSVDCKG